MYDVVIIGAGVIASSIARELMKYEVKVIVVEKELDISCGASKANSAIVHSGYDAPFNSLKGKYNKLGNDIYEEVCRELDVSFKRIGSYVVAFYESEIPILEKLKENGEKLGIKGLRIVSKEEIQLKEPNISKKIIKALYAPSAGITDPWGLTIAYMENAISNGAKLKLDYLVKKIENKKEYFIINNEIKTKIIINASGVYGSQIYKLVCNNPEFIIKPKRGEYYLLDKTDEVVNSVIFQCPSNKGKGVLITPTIEGNILIGPNSEILNEKEKESTNTTEEGLEYIKKCALKIIDKEHFKKTIRNFSGLRAEPSNGDFIIEESKIKNFFNVIGIKSPGLSAAPYIGKLVAGKIKDKLKLNDNKNYNKYRKKNICLNELTFEERKDVIKKNSMYGNIICRCETISEGEIVDAIHSNTKPTTLNSIKRRVRPGSGRCQGGFCGPKVLEIINRELNIPMEEINLERKKSNILLVETKGESYD